MLSLLTVNIGAAGRERAEKLLTWLAKRHQDVLLLTETSAGPGTDHLLNQFRAAGYAVVHTPDRNGDRGTALVSRVRLHPEPFEHFAGASLPGRLAGAVLDTEPRLAVLSVYVPSRDRSLDKTEKKQAFITSLLARLDAMPDEPRGRLVIGGDYNVIARDHQPRHPGFLPFEFGLLEALERHGFVDAHQHCTPGTQAHSWIGRTGDGYRYDYFHVGHELGDRITACAYLHETREQRLTDHAAVSLDLDVEAVERLDTTELLGGDEGMLF
jgi:exodeoxyribonuclease III